jgi:NTP pyrophosphatase (non-canonical NTP hydrolase)
MASKPTPLRGTLSPLLAAQITYERQRAHRKHAPNGGSMEDRPFDDPAWLPVLVEEVGEVARALCDHRHLKLDTQRLADNLRDELIQVAAMATAWIDAIDEMTDGRTSA